MSDYITNTVSAQKDNNKSAALPLQLPRRLALRETGSLYLQMQRFGRSVSKGHCKQAGLAAGRMRAATAGVARGAGAAPRGRSAGPRPRRRPRPGAHRATSAPR